jgi:hypothetical protein
MGWYDDARLHDGRCMRDCGVRRHCQLRGGGWMELREWCFVSERPRATVPRTMATKPKAGYDLHATLSSTGVGDTIMRA